jgi:hypothetical protein
MCKCRGMPDRSRKRPRDFSQAVKLVVDIATGQVEDRELTPESQGKNPAAVALGRLGGLKGGKARAQKQGALRLPAEPQRPGGNPMTAEVAVLNKQGVALAADSIVTISSRLGDKTYNTSNKLFTLSKFQQ